jgi:[pyruvate, water dikinase]-phosphate phosphotransferase / [pyruvate, water dikinase] kinase
MRNGNAETPSETNMTKSEKAAATRKRRPLPAPTASRIIHLLSDSTGNLVRHMLTAFLTQFPPRAFEVRSRTYLSNRGRLEDALDEIAAEPGIVLHAVVSGEAKRQIRSRCSALGVAERDLTGDFVDFLAQQSGIRPAEDHQRLHHVDDQYQRRMRALEYAVQHDDGTGMDSLDMADIVIAGVSRTSKTPTTMYLAQQGYCVANVSLAAGNEPSKQLLEVSRAKVVGLVIDPEQLVAIRTHRILQRKVTDSRYRDLEAVAREVAWTKSLFLRQGWPVLDVTFQAVEETAQKILDVLGLPPVP